MEGFADIKSRLYQQCLNIIEDKINVARVAMDTAQQAADQESKSSVGDKYETGRAMMQLEKEKLMFQIHEALKLKKVLHQINVEERCDDVDLGSVVETSIGNFFVAVSLGKVNAGDATYFTISLASPIGQALHKLKENDKTTFNGKEIVIYKVF